MMRTFMALDLDEPSRRALGRIQRRLDAVGARVRWTEPSNQHVTMKFLGDVVDEDLPAVCRIAAEIASQFDPFEFSVARIVSVPPEGHMRMVWAEIGDPTGRMTEMADELNEAFASLGCKYENRAFRPHLTLGRVKGGQCVDELRHAIERGDWPALEPQYAEELAVYSSQLTKEGPIYTALSHAAMAVDPTDD